MPSNAKAFALRNGLPWPPVHKTIQTVHKPFRKANSTGDLSGRIDL